MKGCCEWAEKPHNKELEALFDQRRVRTIRRADMQKRAGLDAVDECIRKLRDVQEKLRTMRRLRIASGA